jgi:SAM-dependent methyltransferase
MIDQAAYWNGPPAQRWLDEQEGLDAMLRPFGDAALEAARAAAGEAVIDVGCGCGTTTLALADRVGPHGRVVGAELSAPLAARAKERSAGRANVSFVVGDAAKAPLDASSFDVLFSRFGVMFFPDPVAAFRHLRGALRPGGRVAFVCWRPVAENPWAKVPFDAVAEVLGRPEPEPPGAPGPFSFGDRGRVTGVLEGAGFADVAMRAFDASNDFGAGKSLEEAAREIARLGPVARLLVDRSEGDVARAVAVIREAIPPYVRDGAVRFPAAAWVVTAWTGKTPP